MKVVCFYDIFSRLYRIYPFPELGRKHIHRNTVAPAESGMADVLGDLLADDALRMGLLGV